jgi:tetratricopeptide (TPR) repeat protein
MENNNKQSTTDPNISIPSQSLPQLSPSTNNVSVPSPSSNIEQPSSIATPPVSSVISIIKSSDTQSGASSNLISLSELRPQTQGHANEVKGILEQLKLNEDRAQIGNDTTTNKVLPNITNLQPSQGITPIGNENLEVGQSMMSDLGITSLPMPALDINGGNSNQDQGVVAITQYNSIAEYLAGKGDFLNAIKYYEKITNLDQENGAAWTALGHCYLLTDNLQKAFTSYQKALYSLSDVRDPQLWYGIGLLYDKVKYLL